MDLANDEHEEYMKDPRTPCKYGAICYQKNLIHHSKYKHEPKHKLQDKQAEIQLNVKKLKMDEVLSGQEKNVCNSHVKRSDIDVKKHLEHSEKTDVGNSSCHSHASDNNKKSVNQHKLEAEENVHLETPNTSNKMDKSDFIKTKFLVDMPMDFYSFWKFCKSLNENNAANALKDIGLTLVGPYDVLAEKFANVEEKLPEEYLIHWRYYYDPPEFQTVIKGADSTGFHIGYFRDDPNELPVFTASNHSNKNGEIVPMGENIFAAVSTYLEELKKTGDPFRKMHVSKFLGLLKSEADKLQLNLSNQTEKMRARDKKVVTRTFNRAGLVVPYNRKTQIGYRESALSNKDLKKLLNQISAATPLQKDRLMSELQPVLTYATIAADECDFGTGLELGLNLLSCGIESLNDVALQYLKMSYCLLGREAFAKIANAHLTNRKKGIKLSII